MQTIKRELPSNTPIIESPKSPWWRRVISQSSPETAPAHNIIHQPQKFQDSVKFPENPRILNGVSVSKIPKIGERPYPDHYWHETQSPNFDHFQVNLCASQAT
jgi:hypothetical protein